MAKTIEEILQYVKSELDSDDSEIYFDVDDYKVIVEALEQEPCGDCVSREEVLKQMKEWRDCEFVKMTNPYHYLEKRIQSMSPVTPIRPKGHWIDHSDEGFVECSECGSCTNCDGNINNLHFCFSCGAKIESEE